jgi:transcriptional regulator CtsR
MSNISDVIEQYLKALFEVESQEQVEIQRNELAVYFGCVPSQINYVLTTRFTLERGFLIQSRRGGGGYVRIKKIPIGRRSDLIAYLTEIIGTNISNKAAEGIVRRLLEEGLISKRESAMIVATLGSNILNMAMEARDELRAMILKSMIVTLLHFKEEKSGD